MPPVTPTAPTLNKDQIEGWRTIRRVSPYLWPQGQGWVKRRVSAAIFILVLAKLVAIATPLLYKWTVDLLGGQDTSPAIMMGMGAIGLTVAYGMSRILSIGFNQLRDVVFTRVGQRALRLLALET